MAVVPSPDLPARLRALGQLPTQQKVGLILATALVAALLVGAWTWSRTPDYRVLYTNLSDRDGGAIIGALQQMNIPYKFSEGGGAILVPADQVYEARLKLASQGLPKGGLIGFEALEHQKLGTTSFQEQVNYQRALEGELARSIQSISAVQAARVHLAIPHQSVFLRERKPPSASVIIHLYPGRSLDASQVSAVVHLVSSSVPELSPKNVTVVDQNGNLLSANSETWGLAGLDPGQLKYRQQMEHMIARRIEAILAPMVGVTNVRAQVTADVDFSQSEQTAESYKPNASPADAAIRSQRTSEAVTSNGQGATGVPGALSNQPPANPTAPIAGAPAPGISSMPTPPVNSRKESTINYEVDKTIKYTKEPVGTVRRLSAAVVVNYRKVVDSQGKVSYQPLSAEEMKQITALVKDAMGYDSQRGDTVNVVNSHFTVPEVEALPPVPFWKRPETLEAAKEAGRQILIAALAVYLVLGVLRPLLRSLLTPRPVGEFVSVTDSDDASVPAGKGHPHFESNLERAKQLARQDPKVVANVVKSWVGGDER